jgi:hypothetical protein
MPARSLEAGPAPTVNVGRRTFLKFGALAGVAAGLSASPLASQFLASAKAATVDLVQDTLNGLIAFVVPGPDQYSVAQGVSTTAAGGIDTNILEVLIQTIDESAPYLPAFSAVAAAILNQFAQAVHPNVSGPFSSPFACLSFAEKAAVFQFMDATPALAPFSGVIAGIVAFLCYSDAGSFDPTTRTLTSTPVAWSLSNYSGTADGRAELRGYWLGRTHADGVHLSSGEG